MCLIFWAYYPSQHLQNEFCTVGGESGQVTSYGSWTLKEIDAPAAKCQQRYSASVGNFSLAWEFTGADEVELTFSIAGWSYVALGLGASGDAAACKSMANCDIVVASAKGVRDYYTGKAAYRKPNLDKVQSLSATSSTTVGGQTTVVFRRKLDTGDAQDAVLKRSGGKGDLKTRTNIIYAWKDGAAAAGVAAGLGELAFHGSGVGGGGHSIGQGLQAHGAIAIDLVKCT